MKNMLVVSKSKDTILNMDTVSCIYIGEDRRTVKAIAGANDRMYRIGLYDSESEALEAMRMLEKCAQENTFCFPDSQTVKAGLKNAEIQSRERYAGKKQKSHGGS